MNSKIVMVFSATLGAYLAGVAFKKAIEKLTNVLEK